MKRVALISQRPGTSNALKANLAETLGPNATVFALSLEEGLPQVLEMDMVLVTGRAWTSEVIRRMREGTPLLVTLRTIVRHEWESVMSLPARTRVLVVHEDESSAVELMALLYELGARHLEMVHFYPGLRLPADIDLAITSGTPQFVPSGVPRTMNLGVRPIDAVTVLDVMTRLGLMDEAGNARLLRWMAATMPRSQGLRTAIEWISHLRRQHEAVLDHVQDAVVACDQQGQVTFFNHKAQTMFGQRSASVVGRPAKEILPGLDFAAVLAAGNSPIDHLIQVGRAEVMATYVPLKEAEIVMGVVATLRPVGDIWTAEERLRREASSRGHRARHTFGDMIGRSLALRSIIHRAERAAQSHSSVLIEGETGVGKEVLAQAIHNASSRAAYPFVAVNCAALPESLLESELFGYEEGAFTGARRGGKPGLFEQAHRGTIFLDEVGDISPALQARLLRVLEEHEVLRVGGTQVVPVNIRVIAATNRDLGMLVSRAEFRPDLFYRLSVLPLTLPPLRERVEDLPLLFRHFLNHLGYNGEIPPEVMERVVDYRWTGNVRELRNCAEYTLAMADGQITLQDLPASVRQGQGVPSSPAQGSAVGAVGDELVGKTGSKLPSELRFLLREIGRAQTAGQGIGRRALARIAADAGILLTEAEVRLRLNRLEAAGWVLQGRGRGGSSLTPSGRDLIGAESGH